MKITEKEVEEHALDILKDDLGYKIFIYSIFYH